jgi:CheY-like chemotaxis protein
MSPSDEPGLAREAEAAGFDGVLVKPITASDLHDTLAQQLGLGTGEPRRRGTPATDAVSNEEAVRRRHAGRRILLAEDNPINRLVAVELLRAAGLTVETAVDGAEAVDMARSRAFDLILMDMQMPIQDGVSAAREIRLTASLPIIAMTAGASPEDRDACLASGMNDHVSKPVHPTELYATLLRWLPRDE